MEKSVSVGRVERRADWDAKVMKWAAGLTEMVIYEIYKPFYTLHGLELPRLLSWDSLYPSLQPLSFVTDVII